MVMGIGNLLCSDDGVGIHAVRELKDIGLPAQVVDMGAAILHAMPFAEEASHLLVIDAVKAAGAPGSIYEFDGYTMDNERYGSSLHTLGLKQAMEFIAPDQRPPVFRVLGVEPAVVEYGTDLSDAVCRVLPEVILRVHKVVDGWISSEGGKTI